MAQNLNMSNTLPTYFECSLHLTCNGLNCTRSDDYTSLESKRLYMKNKFSQNLIQKQNYKLMRNSVHSFTKLEMHIQTEFKKLTNQYEHMWIFVTAWSLSYKTFTVLNLFTNASTLVFSVPRSSSVTMSSLIYVKITLKKVTDWEQRKICRYLFRKTQRGFSHT